MRWPVLYIPPVHLPVLSDLLIKTACPPNMPSWSGGLGTENLML